MIFNSNFDQELQEPNVHYFLAKELLREKIGQPSSKASLTSLTLSPAPVVVGGGGLGSV